MYLHKEDSCAQCGKTYMRRGSRHTTCSPECAEILKHGAVRKCANCEAPLTPAQPKFCSTECKYELSRKTSKCVKPCPVCNTEFVAWRGQTYCSVPCKNKGIAKIRKFTCQHCGVEFERKNTKDRTYLYCSRACYGLGVKSRKRPEDWTVKQLATGYVAIQTPEGNKLMHRYVMEKKLNRPLREGETVHHINGDRADNAPENLELWTGSQPRGIRAFDSVCGNLPALRLDELEALLPLLQAEIEARKTTNELKQVRAKLDTMMHSEKD